MKSSIRYVSRICWQLHIFPLEIFTITSKQPTACTEHPNNKERDHENLHCRSVFLFFILLTKLRPSDTQREVVCKWDVLQFLMAHLINYRFKSYGYTCLLFIISQWFSIFPSASLFRVISPTLHNCWSHVFSIRNWASPLPKLYPLV